MGILTALRKMLHSFYTPTLNTFSIKCPSCKNDLKNIPKQDTTCPHCGVMILVSTFAKDQMNLLMTYTDTKGNKDAHTATKPQEESQEFIEERNILRERFGKEPSLDDVKWGIFNKELLKNSKDGDWGLYRNTRLDMADFLAKKMKLKDALRDYLEVCYIDLNGPTNSNSQKSRDLLKKYPAFDHNNLSFLAPAVIGYIAKKAKELALNEDGIKKIFMEHNKNVYRNLKLPLSPEKCWDKVEKAIYKK